MLYPSIVERCPPSLGEVSLERLRNQKGRETQKKNQKQIVIYHSSNARALRRLLAALFLFLLTLLLLLSQEVTIVDAAHDDILVVDHLAVHVGEEALLLGEEGLEPLRGYAPPGGVAVAQLLELLTHPLLQDLQPVLCELVVQLAQVRDRPHRRQHRVVADLRRPRPERRHHTDALRRPESPERLVFDVAPLEYHGTSLIVSSRR